jgi:N-methylhydantoinase B
VDPVATAAARAQLRDGRRRAASAAPLDGGEGERWTPEADGVRLSEALFCDLSRRPPVYRCRCGHVLGSVDVAYKQLAARAIYPVQRIGPEVNPHRIGGNRFELREFYCPRCFTLLEVEIARPHDPIIDDARLALTP